MEILLLLGLLSLFFGGSGKDKDKKRKKRRSRRKPDNSWLDAAWFHDHNQPL